MSVVLIIISVVSVIIGVNAVIIMTRLIAKPLQRLAMDETADGL